MNYKKLNLLTFNYKASVTRNTLASKVAPYLSTNWTSPLSFSHDVSRGINHPGRRYHLIIVHREQKLKLTLDCLKEEFIKTHWRCTLWLTRMLITATKTSSVDDIKAPISVSIPPLLPRASLHFFFSFFDLSPMSCQK